jgi:hypothetical protein
MPMEREAKSAVVFNECMTGASAMRQTAMMDINLQWRVESLYGIDAWIRDLDGDAPEDECFFLAVWRDPWKNRWEWEVIDLPTDRHIAGATAFTRESAMQEAEAVAMLFGFRSTPDRRLG